jgi:hypothetical protein
MNVDELDANLNLDSPNVNLDNNLSSPRYFGKYFFTKSEDGSFDGNNFTDFGYMSLRTDEVQFNPYSRIDSFTSSQSVVKQKVENQNNPNANEMEYSFSIIPEEEGEDDNCLEDDANNKKKESIRGRPSKKNPRKGKHTRKSNDNGIKVLIKSCSRSIHDCLQKDIETFIGKKRNIHGNIINTKLHVPTTNKYLIKGKKEKLALFNSPVKDIYYKTIPKRVKNKIKNQKEKYSYNKEVLNDILKIEEKDDNINQKQLNIKFNAEFKIYLEAYLKNKKNITINGIKFELNDEFKTLKDCFNEGKNKYTKKEKEGFKNSIIDILGKNFDKKIKKANKEINYILIK